LAELSFFPLFLWFLVTFWGPAQPSFRSSDVNFLPSVDVILGFSFLSSSLSTWLKVARFVSFEAAAATIAGVVLHSANGEVCWLRLGDWCRFQ